MAENDLERQARAAYDQFVIIVDLLRLNQRRLAAATNPSVRRACEDNIINCLEIIEEYEQDVFKRRVFNKENFDPIADAGRLHPQACNSHLLP